MKFIPYVYGHPREVMHSSLLEIESNIKSILSGDIAITQHFKYSEKVGEKDIIPVMIANEFNTRKLDNWIIEVDIGRIESQVLNEGSEEVLLLPSTQARDLAEKLAKAIWNTLKRQSDVLAQVKYNTEEQEAGSAVVFVDKE